MIATEQRGMSRWAGVSRGIADADLVLDLARVRNTRLPVALYIATSLALGAPLISHLRGVVVIVLLYAAAAIINDIFDVDIDRFNERSVPLADGRCTEAFSRRLLVAALFMCGVAASGLQSYTGSALVFLAFLLSLAYSVPGARISDRGLLSSILLAILYGCFPLFLAAAEHGQARLNAGLVAAVFGLALCTALNKDYTDAPGDEAFGKRTPVVRYGESAVTRAVVVVLGFSGAIAALTLDRGVWIGLIAIAGATAVRIAITGPSPRLVAALRVLATFTAVAMISTI